METKKGNLKMETKKGQLTIFVIAAVVFVIGIFILLFVSSSNKWANDQENRKPFDDFVYGCMYQVGQDAIEEMGIHGGYYEKPSHYYDLNGNFLPYYYYEGQNLMPSKEDIEFQISNYVEDFFSDCLSKYGGDFNIEYSDVEVVAVIEEKDVKIEVDSNIRFEKDGNVLKIKTKKNPMFITTKLHDILFVADYLMESHFVDPNWYCVNCVGDILTEKELFLYDVRVINDTVLVLIAENKSFDSYSFAYVNKYIEDNSLNLDDITEEELGDLI